MPDQRLTQRPPHFSASTYTDIHFAGVPLYLPTLLFALPAIWLIPSVLRARTLARKGKCPHCLYDLTANTSGTCPECGNPIPALLWRSTTTPAGSTSGIS